MQFFSEKDEAQGGIPIGTSTRALGVAAKKGCFGAQNLTLGGL